MLTGVDRSSLTAWLTYQKISHSSDSSISAYRNYQTSQLSDLIKEKFSLRDRMTLLI